MRAAFSTWLLCASSVACGGYTDNDNNPSSAKGGAPASGATGGTTAGSGGTGATTSSGGSGGTVVEPGPFTGTWKGYVENYAFSDGSDVIVMQLDAVTAQVSGRITFGESAPLPPPTDPNVGYPPGVTGGPSVQITIHPGFSYSLLSGSFDGQRLEFKVPANELWKQWCEMQTSIADEVNDGMYSCLPNWGGGSQDGKCFQDNPKTGEKVYVDCGKWSLCASGGSPCDCTATGCTVTLESGIAFDMILAPPKADGSVAGLDGSVHNVHFTRE